MPELNRAQFVQLAVLVLAVPVQYLLSRSSTENFRQFELKRVITGITELNSLFDLKSLLRWCQQFWTGPTDDDQAQEPPVEVLEQHDKNGYFASSTTPRTPRPPFVKFRVGQVFKHKVHGYRGVIIGWDPEANAPESWLNRMHKNRPEWRKMPNYSVLVCTRDRLTPQMAYVIEQNIELVQGVRIMHPLIEHYFEEFDGGQYLMRPWLRKIYPQD